MRSDLDLEVRLEDAGLELDRTEAELVHHSARFADHLVVRDDLAPIIGRIAGVVPMPLELVEQVGTVGHPIAHGPAEDLVEGAAGGLPLQVEECDLEGGERRRTRLVALRRDRCAPVSASPPTAA